MTNEDLTLEDAYKIVEFGQKAHAETRYKTQEFNPKSALQFLGLFKQFPNKYYIQYHKNNNDEVIAVFFGQVSIEYFSGKVIATDLGMFVHPNYRGSPMFVKMLLSFERWAKERGANKVILYHSTGIEPEKTKRLFSKLEYVEFGSIFDKEI